MMGRHVLLVASVAAVFLQLPGRLEWAAAAAGLQLLSMVTLDRDAFRALGRWRLWALIAAVSLLSGLLLAPPAAHLGPLPLSLQGVRTAVMMVCRAVTLFGVAVVVSRQLTAERVIRAAQRLRMPQVGLALGVALETLPRLVSAARNERALRRQDRARGPLARLMSLENIGIRLLRYADGIAQEMAAGLGDRVGGPCPPSEHPLEGGAGKDCP